MLTPGERNAVNQSSAAQVASMKSTKKHSSSQFTTRRPTPRTCPWGTRVTRDALHRHTQSITGTDTNSLSVMNDDKSSVTAESS